ncbi:MAG: DNA primase [Pseudomonadota bacterium]
MSGRIPQEFINDLLLRVDIVEVITARVPLKRQGANFVACCPFHNEKTPSFSVNQTKQFYHCFGCGASGNAIRFLMENDRLEFVEAIEELASMAGVPVERVESATRQLSPQSENFQRFYALMETAAQYYEQQLRKAKDAIDAVKYLQSRGLDGVTCQQFRVGYVSDQWEGVKQHLLSHKYALEDIVTCGLATRKNNKSYDRFRHRIIFPIRDKRQRVIAFGGRVLGKGEPKYLNSPETPIFHKSNELYNFDNVSRLRNLSEVIVVEGYLDVIALSQHNITNSVAALGTATSAKHVQMLFRVSDRILFCFDGDRAGREAAWKALETALPHVRGEKELHFLFLDDKDDPDTAVRRLGKEGFLKLLSQAAPLSRFMINQLALQTDASTLDGKAKIVAMAKPLVEKIEDDFYRSLIVNAIAKELKVNLETWQDTFEDNQANAKSPQPSNHVDLSMTPMRRAIALILQHPAQIKVLSVPGEKIALLPLKGSEILGRLLARINETEKTHTAALLSEWEGHQAHALLQQLATWERPGDDATLEKEFQDCIRAMIFEAESIKLEALQTKAQHQGLDAQEKQALKHLLKLQKRRNPSTASSVNQQSDKT